MKELKLTNVPIKILQQSLLKNGFKTYGGNIFTYQSNVGNKLILAKIAIDLENKEVELDVIKKSNMEDYMPFYNNINGENNKFALRVIEDVNNLVNKLTKEGIFKGGKKK